MIRLGKTESDRPIREDGERSREAKPGVHSVETRVLQEPLVVAATSAASAWPLLHIDVKTTHVRSSHVVVEAKLQAVQPTDPGHQSIYRS